MNPKKSMYSFAFGLIDSVDLFLGLDESIHLLGLCSECRVDTGDGFDGLVLILL